MRLTLTIPRFFWRLPLRLCLVALLTGAILFAGWRINNDVVPTSPAQPKVTSDNPPHVTLTALPSLTENKMLHIAYTAADDVGVKQIALLITPHDPMPGADDATVEIPLPAPVSKNITRDDSEDLTAHPWAGQKVTMQIVATNQAGKQGSSDTVDFTFPDRSFFHPIARALIEERKKLMLRPDDEMLRNEAANIMADIAHETINYHGDPVILMALRSGAVRLVLERSHDAVLSVNDLLWQTATRIEDGATGAKQGKMPDVWQDLAQRSVQKYVPGDSAV